MTFDPDTGVIDTLLCWFEKTACFSWILKTGKLNSSSHFLKDRYNLHHFSHAWLTLNLWCRAIRVNCLPDQYPIHLLIKNKQKNIYCTGFIYAHDNGSDVTTVRGTHLLEWRASRRQTAVHPHWCSLCTDASASSFVPKAERDFQDKE